VTSPESRSDYIIVGAGSAGAVLANRLSNDASVALFEAGPEDHWWDFRVHMPAALSHVLSNDTYNWYYHSEPESELADRPMYCPRGRVLGGSSSINGMIYVRGNPADYDQWAEAEGMESWAYEHCLPYFQKAETRRHGDAEFSGTDGPLQVGRGAGIGPLNDAWLAAGQEAGYRLSNDFNGAEQEGVGTFDCTILNGRRLSTARAYLHPISERKTLQIHKKTLVSRILFEGKRAIGVEYQQRGKVMKHYAEKEVIISGGAINSPQLLMLSGVGPADHLRELDIPLICDLPGVGQNLQDHLEIYVQYSCDAPVSIYPSIKWYRQPFVGMQWYLFNTGAGATNHFETGAFLRSSNKVMYPDLQFHFLPVAMNYDGSDKYEGHGFQVHVGPMKPTSRGAITLRSADPREAPRIQFDYNSTEEDREVMRRGIEMVREIVSQPAFDGLRGQELRPGSGDADDIDEFIRDYGESAYHPSCTCKMGLDEMAVVDAVARVHGLEGLRVIDASIMPDVTNGNLNAPVIMMAEKLSDAILGNV